MAFAARAAVLATVALTAACGGGGGPSSKPSAAPTLAERAVNSVATRGLATERRDTTATLLPSGKVLVAGGAGLSGTLKSCELFDPQTGNWTAAGSLAADRNAHTATLLPSGKVLVAGGMTGAYPDSSIASAELYDPATDRWTATGALQLARTGASATLLANGKVLVAGGWNVAGGTTKKSELYDPSTGSWSYTGDLDFARGGQVATRLRDGRVLVTGGTNDTTAGEVYDPATGFWSPTPGTGMNRAGHTATLLGSGAVLVAGGIGTNSAQLYDPATNAWSSAAIPPVARESGAATLLPSGRVLVTGGYGAGATSSIYDPLSDGWSTGPALTTARSYHRAVMLPSGKVLLASGWDASGTTASVEVVEARTGSWTLGQPNPVARLNVRAALLQDGRALFASGSADGVSSSLAAQVYDPSTGSWTAANLARTRDGAALVTLPSGKVLITGGEGGSGPVAEAELFDPATDTWSLVEGPITPRSGHCAVILPDGKVLVAGGTTAFNPVASAELYDPATGSWTVTGSMATPRMQFTATVLRSGAVLVAGGMGLSGVVDGAELFDPATGSWSTADRPAKPRARAAAALLPSGAVLLTGGYATADGGPAADVELYDPGSDAWRALPAMAIRREMHSATVLATGEVMAVGGSGGTSEIFDPATERWQGAGPTSSMMAHAALLLPSGQVIVSGGHDGTAPTAATWLFDLDVETVPDLLPVVSPPAASAEQGKPFALTGTRFRMGSEAAPGALPNTSAIGPPMVQLRGYSGRLDWLPVSAETDTAVTFTVPSDLPTGRYLVAVVAGGVASAAVPLTVVPPAPPPPTDPTPPADEPADSPLAFSCGNGAGGPALASLALIALALGRRRGRSLLAALLVLLPLAATATPPPVKGVKGGKGRIAVMPLKAGTGVDPQLVEMVTDAFVAELYRRGIATITMSDVEAALGFERQKQLLGCQDDRSCLAEIAGALGTDRIVSGSVSRVEAVTAVRLQLFDSRAAVVEKRFYETHSGATAAQLLEAARRAGGVLFPEAAGGAVAQAPSEPQGQPAPRDPVVAAAEPRQPVASGPSGELAPAPVPVAQRFSVGTGALYDPVDPGGFASVLAEWRHPSGVRLGAGPVVTGAATFGLAARAAWTPLPGRRLRPFAAIHALAVFDGEPLFWGGVGLGAEWAFDAHLSIGVDLPVFRILSGPETFKDWYLLPGLSVAWTP